MVKHPSRVLALALSLATPVLGGCVEDQELFYVSHAVAVDGEACTLSTGGAPLVSDTIDVALTGSIGIGLVLQNVQTGNSGSNTGLSDDGEIKLEYAEVSLSLEGISVGYEVPLATDSLPSGDELAVLVQLPSTALDEIRGAVAPMTTQTMTMSVVVVGERTGQAAGGKLGEVRTRQYDFPFQVCSNCLGCTPSCNLAQGSACPSTDEETTG